MITSKTNAPVKNNQSKTYPRLMIYRGTIILVLNETDHDRPPFGYTLHGVVLKSECMMVGTTSKFSRDDYVDYDGEITLRNE